MLTKKIILGIKLVHPKKETLLHVPIPIEKKGPIKILGRIGPHLACNLEQTERGIGGGERHMNTTGIVLDRD